MIYYKNYKPVEPVLIGKGKRIIDNNIYSFDIEVTSYLKINNNQYNFIEYENFNDKQKELIEYHSLMYIWMFSINETVYYGRTWDELKDFLNKLENDNPHKKIVFIHNLSYEFQFLKSQFTLKDVMARTTHKVMKCMMMDYNIEFHCTYYMSNTSLEKLAEVYKLPIKKLKGNLDYNTIRSPLTTLTENELAYCNNDCLVIYEYIKMELENYIRVDKIPITSTGKVRRELKELTVKNFFYKMKTRMATNDDPIIYNRLLQAFQGGYTHANYSYADLLLHNVDSYDFTSSYPYVMVAYKFPMTKFYKCNIASRSEMLSQFAYLIVVKFYDIECKYFNHFISRSKCREVIGGKYDNGRVIKAKELEITLTDIDFYFILDTYDCSKYEILESYFSGYNYLPKELINFILDKYVMKTKLKDVEGEEINYARIKSLFNSIYGMTVTNEIKSEVTYDNVEGWIEKELTNEEIEKKLIDIKKKGFLSFSWGVWVTAYARNNLLRNVVELDEHAVYMDTDSIKLIEGYDKNVIINYNNKVKERIINVSKLLKIPINKYAPEDIKGNRHMLGLFESETKQGNKFTYDEFITQGAKKYAVKSNGKIKITVAGVPKIDGAKALKDLNDFRDNFIFKSSITNKKMLVYIDDQTDDEIIDYQGNKYINKDISGICMLPCSYELGKALEYADLLSDLSSKRAIYKEGEKNE